ncbi:glyoxalase [Agromyces sp. MMS24-K17]|uniref:glyoxalase n=1 Tax=Agromyces sp. MMS24-K17 TaxID=3372850 RepID=UPI00375491B0
MNSTDTITTIDSVTLETDDTAAAADAERFYATAFGIGDRVKVRATDAPTSGFRGYTLSLNVAQPADVRLLFERGLAAGATVVKPVEKSLWGVGGNLRAPDGAIWTIATSAKKDSGPATADIERIVLLLGADDIGATKRFYVDRGLAVGKSFGAYVEFTTPGSPILLGLYKRRALAKAAGVPAEGSGSHRLVIDGGGAFTDPDGFAWGTGA